MPGAQGRSGVRNEVQGRTNDSNMNAESPCGVVSTSQNPLTKISKKGIVKYVNYGPEMTIRPHA